MNKPENLLLVPTPVPGLDAAIDRWLAARGGYKKRASGENQHGYNAAYFALGEAWAERYPKAADVPGAFEWFRCSLIAPEMDE